MEQEEMYEKGCWDPSSNIELNLACKDPVGKSKAIPLEAPEMQVRRPSPA